jgi:hypothetical protein
MKNQLRKLQLLSRFIDLEEYFVITIYKGRIHLQASYNSEIVIMCLKLNFTYRILENGYVEFYRNNIYITLC